MPELYNERVRTEILLVCSHTCWRLGKMLSNLKSILKVFGPNERQRGRKESDYTALTNSESDLQRHDNGRRMGWM
jgi:hypothetical protein